MSSEGRHEIEAARNRLAAARAQASSAAKNVELAKATMQHAESMLQTSTEEVGAAEKGLTEAEKRWGVISIDVDDDANAETTADGNSRKRKKVSLSPEAREGGSNDAEPSAVANGARQLFPAPSSNTHGGGSATAPNDANAGVAMASFGEAASLGRRDSAAIRDITVSSVLVEGAGVSAINGSYRATARYIGGAVSWVKETGSNDGLKYVVFRRGGHWILGSSINLGDYPRTHYYKTPSRIIGPAPFRRNEESYSWIVANSGVAPAPTVKHRTVPARAGGSVATGGRASEVRSASASAANANDAAGHRLDNNGHAATSGALHQQPSQASQAQQRRHQQQQEERPAPGSVLPKKHTDELLVAIKRLVSTWADEEQMNGANVFYWNILSGNNMAMVAAKVPTSMQELSGCGIPENVQNKYGERLLSGVKDFLAQRNLMHCIERVRDIPGVVLVRHGGGSRV